MDNYEARIAEWLCNDPALRDPALALAKNATGLEAVNPLHSWVNLLLFDIGYGVQVDDLLWISNRDADVETARKIRSDLGSLLFSLANWDHVCQLVLAHHKKEM
jgi:hypothetical protein